MSFTIQIEVNASLQDSGLIHRILNFKEEIHRDFLQSGAAAIFNPKAVDRALEPLTIIVQSKRTLAAVSKSIDKAAMKHDVVNRVHAHRVA